MLSVAFFSNSFFLSFFLPSFLGYISGRTGDENKRPLADRNKNLPAFSKGQASIERCSGNVHSVEMKHEHN